ncbi:hypothetical protein B6N60_01247 [Richelia sinica FACHB-800]|uniref:GmrSD restriction endonucleases C-terminal domain-containing protein n=1 Tax=Richelia sinica FACHB-800 TaxID=1357546 RepID=A0A975T5L5_9NOST|nr:HNH endonuclease family protein [Richelia sinica]QXE22564.1 hypothetical protein B6N60_01247 [Richelia sinica FACHB-800]
MKINIFREDSVTKSQIQETIYTHNLESAKRFFSERLSEISHEEKESIFLKLTQKLLFNLYTISNDIDVFIAFETMNNRGKPLSVLELLKNRLIYLSTKLNVEEYEKISLRNIINESWKTVYHNLGKNKENPLDDDKFLFNHFVLYFGKETKPEYEISPVELFGINIRSYNFRSDYSRVLLEEIFTAKNIAKNNSNNNSLLLTTKFINSYVQDLQQSVELWYKISNPYFSDFSENEKIWLDKLNRVVNNDTVSFAPLIMVFFKKEPNREKRVKFLKTLELLMFFSVLIGLPSYAILRLNGFNTLEKSINLSNRTIEHIYPQKAKDKYWIDTFRSYTPKEKTILKNSLGNLLPLSKAKNSSCSNKAFPDKKCNDINNVGYRYGSYSENEVALYEHWTAKEILERGIKLINFMENRWKISIGDYDAKVEFLGLGFVLKKEGLN